MENEKFFDENGSPEMENVADDWEEQQEILREINDFKIGDDVIISNSGSPAAALWGIGVHTVENFIDGKIQVRMWNGKRCAFFERGEIERFFCEA